MRQQLAMFLGNQLMRNLACSKKIQVITVPAVITFEQRHRKVITLNLSQAQAPENTTSLPVPGCPIGRADGQDRASPGHFAKKKTLHI
jgi:hypothetical protein